MHAKARKAAALCNNLLLPLWDSRQVNPRIASLQDLNAKPNPLILWHPDFFERLERAILVNRFKLVPDQVPPLLVLQNNIPEYELLKRSIVSLFQPPRILRLLRSYAS